MTVTAPLTTKSATIALMSPIADTAVKSSIPILTDSDTSLNGNDETPSDSSLSGSCDGNPSLPAIAPIVTVYQSTAGTNKRPQMKYDPEVPLSKEETSVWRREQRRKRNRESAAACRKRQRDRISELEVEVEEWKVKFDEIVKRLGEVEGENVMGIIGDIERLYPEKKRKCVMEQDERSVSPTTVTISTNACNMVTPPNAHTFLPPVTTSVSGIDFPVLQDVKTESAFIKADSIHARVEKGQHLSEKITRPAASRLYLFRRRQLGLCFGGVPTQ
jgi:hypothetical protein